MSEPDTFADIPDFPADEVIAAIHAAFKDVSREGGVSWTECEAIDAWATEEECAKARAKDTDTRWSQVLGDPEWRPFPGTGGFAFIDGIGFRYYAAPTMIRMVRREDCEWYGGHFLSSLNAFVWQYPFTPAQRDAAARFVAHMARHDPEHPDAWAEAFRERYARYLLEEPRPDR